MFVALLPVKLTGRLTICKIGCSEGYERKARAGEYIADERKEFRLNDSLPIVKELGKQIAIMQKEVLLRSPFGDANNYVIPRWDSLVNYLYDGMLEIDTNRVENVIRPNALGRKNYLFAGSHSGAQ